MGRFQTILSDLVRSIVQHPGQVVITETNKDPLAFEIKISRLDYEPVLCKLSAIKSLAAACSDLSEDKKVIVYLKPA